MSVIVSVDQAEALHRVVHATGLGEALRIGTDYASGFGLDRHTYVHTQWEDLQNTAVRRFTDYPPEWVARYDESGYAQCDPVVSYTQQVRGPLRWEAFDRYPLPPRNRRVMEEARDFGLHRGVSMCFISPDGRFNGASFAGRRGRMPEAEVLFLSRLMRVASSLYSAPDKVITEIDQELFTNRELECMGLSIKGNTDRQIGGLLDIEERTVRYHIEHAKGKSSSTTRAELFYKIGRYSSLLLTNKVIQESVRTLRISKTGGWGGRAGWQARAGLRSGSRGRL